jgi:hypothetical protein
MRLFRTKNLVVQWITCSGRHLPSLTGESHADLTDADASVLANYPHSPAAWAVTKGERRWLHIERIRRRLEIEYLTTLVPAGGPLENPHRGLR